MAGPRWRHQRPAFQGGTWGSSPGRSATAAKALAPAVGLVVVVILPVDTPPSVTIDTTTGLGAAVGPLTGTTTVVNAYTDVSFDAGGTLYLFQDVPEQLFTVDTTSGAATPLPLAPGLGGAGNAIAFDPAGTLFWGQSDRASTLDPTTGVATSGPPFTFPASCEPARLAAADFPTSGEAFGVLKCAEQGLDDRLVRVDFAAATVTEVGPFTDSATQLQIVGFDAIAVEQPVSPE